MLLLFIFGSVLSRRQDYQQYFSFSSWPDLGQSRYTVTRPRDLERSGPREVRPQDDQTLFAHEPIEVGTLRDVWCVTGRRIPNLCLYYRVINKEDNFYLGGTLTLGRKSDYPGPVVYNPYPDYNSDQWRKEFICTFLAYNGPRGRLLSRSNIVLRLSRNSSVYL